MKKLLVLSGKGGTGKTTVASAIIELSKARAFADCDVDAPNLDILNKVNSLPKKSDFIGGDKAFINKDKCIGCKECIKNCRFDAIKFVDGKAQVDEYACEGCGVCSIVCKFNAVNMQEDKAGELLLFDSERKFSTAKLKMGRGNSGKLVSEVKSGLFKVTNKDDFVVLDGSPGIGCPVMASISGVDFVLIVTEPTKSGKSDLERICKTLEKCGVLGGVCINKWDLSDKMSEEIENWCEENNIPFLGKISYDSNASKFINEGKSIVLCDCKMSDELKKVYEKTIKLMGA